MNREHTPNMLCDLNLDLTAKFDIEQGEEISICANCYERIAKRDAEYLKNRSGVKWTLASYSIVPKKD